MIDEHFNSIAATTIPIADDKNQETTPKSRNKTTTNTKQRTSIQLLNPHKRKNKPVNKSFARQLKDFMEVRTTPDRESSSSTQNKIDKHDPPEVPLKNPYAPEETMKRKHLASTNSLSNTTYQPPDPFILINDGTPRMTIRWKPEDFDQLAIDPIAFDRKLTSILNRIFGEHTAMSDITGEMGGATIPGKYYHPRTSHFKSNPDLSVSEDKHTAPGNKKNVHLRYAHLCS